MSAANDVQDITLDLKAAASLLKLSEDALARKARAGIVPGAKVGRRWVFVRSDLVELIRRLAAKRTGRSIAPMIRMPTGPATALTASAKLDARLKELNRRT